MIKRIIVIVCIVFFVSPILPNQWHDEADRCWNEAKKYKKDRNYNESIEYLKKAITAERKNENPRSENLILELFELGSLYDITGTFDKSLHYYQLALATALKYSNNEMITDAYYNIGRENFKLNNMQDALSSYKEAIEIAIKNNFEDRIAVIYNDMAMVSRVKKNFSDALEYYLKAYNSANKSIYKSNIAAILSNMGTMYFFKGEFEKSLELYTKALTLDRASGNEEYSSINLSNVGSVYAALGKFGEALNYFEKALETDILRKNDVNIASRYNRIGDIYYRLGDNTRALENYVKSLNINMKINNRINASHVLNNIGHLYESMGKYEDAMENYIKALNFNKELEITENISARLSDIGMFYKTRDRYSEAVDFLGKALLQDIMSEKKSLIAENLSTIGQILILQKQYDKALTYFDQSMHIYRELNESALVADDLKNSGIVYFYGKDFSKAAECFENAIKMVGTIKKEQDQKVEGITEDIYRWYIATCVRGGNSVKALEIIEEFSRIKIPLRADQGSVSRIRKSFTEFDIKKGMGPKSALVIFSNVEWDSPALVAADNSSTSCYELDKEGLINSIYAFAAKEIEQYIGERKIDIVFKLNQNTRKDLYYAEFERIVGYYRYLLSKKYITSEEYELFKKISAAIYIFLFNKIEKNIAEKDVLLIQPGGVLSTIPFETLIMPDGSFMAEKYDIVYQKSSNFEGRAISAVNGSGRKGVLSFGNFTSTSRTKKMNIESPRHFEMINKAIIQRINNEKSINEFYGFFGLDEINGDSSQNEIDSIKSINKDCAAVTGESASENKIKIMSQKGVLREYNIIHFGDGGVVVPEVPSLSSIAVMSGNDDGSGNDGFLNYKEIAGLSLHSELVHVSGLRIPQARYTRGEGIWTICGALFVSGAKNVSFSLWPVEDNSKIYFMKQVYQLMLGKGVGVAKAFADTKRMFIRGKVDFTSQNAEIMNKTGSDANRLYTNPYFWGSFVLYGQ